MALISRTVMPRAYIDTDGVEENQRIVHFHRPALPFGDSFQHGVGDGRNQVGRHVQPIELQKMALNLPDCHAARIHRHDPVVEAGKPALVALDQLQVEGSLPIAPNADVDLRRLRQDRLLRRAVATISATPQAASDVKVIVQLGVQNPFCQSLLQLIE